MCAAIIILLTPSAVLLMHSRVPWHRPVLRGSRLRLGVTCHARQHPGHHRSRTNGILRHNPARAYRKQVLKGSHNEILADGSKTQF